MWAGPARAFSNLFKEYVSEGIDLLLHCIYVILDIL